MNWQIFRNPRRYWNIESIFDIESIVSKIRSIRGVVKADTYQPVKIEWHEDWIKKDDSK